MEAPIFEALLHSVLFKGVNESEIIENLAHVRFFVKSFEKGAIIVKREDKVEYLMIVADGIVRGEMVDFSGKLIKIEEMEKGQPLASAFLFSTQNTFPVDVIASSDCKILYIGKLEVLKLLQNNQKFLLNFLTSVSNRSQFLSKKLFMLSFKTIRGKLAQFLLEKAKDNLRVVELKQTQQDLADLFGVTRPSLARVISELENEAVIRTDRKTITILDKNKLIALLNQ